MPGKQQKVFSNDITSYLEADTEWVGSKETETALHDLDTPVTLHAIKNIVAQAMGQIRTEFRYMKKEVNKSLDALETHFDAKLTTISERIDTVQATQGEVNRKVKTVRN